MPVKRGRGKKSTGRKQPAKKPKPAKKKSTGRKAAKKPKKLIIARVTKDGAGAHNFKTVAGARRAVFEGRADRTAGGLVKKDLIKNLKTGKIVSRKAHAQPLNSYIKASQKAAKSGAASFRYKNKLYKRSIAKTGLVVYKKARGSSARRSSGGRRRSGGRR